MGTGPDDIRAETRIETKDPETTLSAAIDWLARAGDLTSIGIASFGPIELDQQSDHWGYITNTPKPGWQNVDFAGRVRLALGLPVGFDTDVNAAALAEARWGAATGQRVSVYVTVGTGIGGGLVIDGKTHHGLGHPEMGHFWPRLHPADVAFDGICSVHGTCLEGLASGPAIRARWGGQLSDLAPDHPAHEIVAGYLAQLVVALQAMFQPGRIILGGGVMATEGLLDRVRLQAMLLGGGYFQGRLEEVLRTPALGDHSGLLGAMVLAMDLAQSSSA